MEWGAAATAVFLAILGIAAGSARAQIGLPSAAPPDPATLFTRQCGTCHTAADGQAHRQGPNLFGIVGREAGAAPGFRYSAGLAGAGFAWDEDRLDTYLTNPQAVIATSTMAYRQANPATRRTLITWLREQR